MVRRTTEALPKRLGIRVKGLVQGVGFRPHVHGLARRHGLTGWVCNDGGGVNIEVQGAELERFVTELRAQAPPLARIDELQTIEIPLCREHGFDIRTSHPGPVTTAITPDSGVCEDCLTELFEPHSRYYSYPFLNCTRCGPRYTVTRALPYDRARTSMAAFPMCDACAREYRDPDDRRFHAQPTACAICGPRLSMPVGDILGHIEAGRIVALKGLGGYHLVCDARNEQAVRRLRQRKNREEKPFAVMMANLASAARLAYCDAAAGALLEDDKRPIVLLPKRDAARLAPAIAPGLRCLGVMLPYTPLHYLLFHEAAGRPDGTAWLHRPQTAVFVMTSANPGGEPLVTDDTEATRRLAGIADVIVSHDRPICVRADDSVMQVLDGAPAVIRRARGYVPEAIGLARELPTTLALGAYLKNTICITRGREAFVSQHIGDLNNPQTIDFFEETVAHLLGILAVEPERVAHDTHPDFYSTRFAASLGLPAVAVQHHHAHLAAVAAEHGVTEPAVGLALDGFGLGENNASWGGELLFLEETGYTRLGHLAPLKQPGGEVAAREPWRMAAAVLERLGRTREITTRFTGQRAAGRLAGIMDKNINCPPTTSCGRLFDAACGLLGLQPVTSFEGQAAMRLEGLVTETMVLPNGWRIDDEQLDLLPLMARLADCDDVVAGANLFHGTLTAALTEWAAQAARRAGVRTVLLGGGCLLNHVLAQGLNRQLAARGLRPLTARQVPPNDGGLSLGQAWVAGNRNIEAGSLSEPMTG